MDYPAEIIYQIIATAVAEHIDDLVAGPLSFRDAKETDPLPENEPYTPALRQLNPILPLLQVSFKFRDTTLLVLSDTLGIPRGEDGRLTTYPWSQITRLRHLFHPGINKQKNSGGLILDILDLYTCSPFASCYVSLAVSEATLALEKDGFSYVDARDLRCDHFERVLAKVPEGPLREVLSRRCAEFVHFSEKLLYFSGCSRKFRYPFEMLSSCLNMPTEEMDSAEIEKEINKLVDNLVEVMHYYRDDFNELQPQSLEGLASPSFRFPVPDIESRHEKYKPLMEDTRTLLHSIKDFPSPHPDYDLCREVAKDLLGQWPFRVAEEGEEPSGSWMFAICAME